MIRVEGWALNIPKLLQVLSIATDEELPRHFMELLSTSPEVLSTVLRHLLSCASAQLGELQIPPNCGPLERVRLVRSIRSASSVRHAQLILEHFAGDDAAPVRMSVAEQLGDYPDAEFQRALLMTLSEDHDFRVRLAALEALPRHAAPWIMQLLDRGWADDALTVRLTALDALLRRLDAPHQLDALRRALDDPDLEVRRAALRLSIKVPAEERRALVKPHLFAADPDLRAEAGRQWRHTLLPPTLNGRHISP